MSDKIIHFGSPEHEKKALILKRAREDNKAASKRFRRDALAAILRTIPDGEIGALAAIHVVIKILKDKDLA